MSFGFFGKKHPGSYNKLGVVSQKESFNYMNCVDKPTLTLDEAMDTLYQPAQSITEKSQTKGFHKITTLFEHIRGVIVNEIQERKTNTTPEVKFKVEQLNGLLDKLDTLSQNPQADGNTDIKALIRSHINQQELDAADPKKNGGNTMGQCVLWDDIRRALNEQIGFQEELIRNPETVALLTIKSPVPTSKNNEQLNQLRSSTLQGPDASAMGRVREYIQSYESGVENLIEEAKKSIPAP